MPQQKEKEEQRVYQFAKEKILDAMCNISMEAVEKFDGFHAREVIAIVTNATAECVVTSTVAQDKVRTM